MLTSNNYLITLININKALELLWHYLIKVAKYQYVRIEDNGLYFTFLFLIFNYFLILDLKLELQKHLKMLFIRNRPAIEPVILKVYNVKLSFDIWLVLYIHFILYS